MEVRKVIRIGYSLKVTIPSDYARELGIEEGDYVKIEKKGKKIIIMPAVVR